MVAIVGLVVLMICVFGGFIIAGGSLAPIIKAAPYEMFIIGGAGIGGMITGNSGVILKGAFGGFGRVIKGPKYKKEDYLAVMLLVAKIMKTLKTEGAVALEAHIENPEASAIFVLRALDHATKTTKSTFENHTAVAGDHAANASAANDEHFIRCGLDDGRQGSTSNDEAPEHTNHQHNQANDSNHLTLQTSGTTQGNLGNAPYQIAQGRD